VALLHGYTTTLPLVVLVENGANISRGRNLAFEHTHGDVIAISDAGVTLPDDWLERLIAPLEADASVQVACGFFRADPHTVFEVAMGATVLPLASEITPPPSCQAVAVLRCAVVPLSAWGATLNG
jgi:cellulose synthase/poly-beta-1,6-N-acetylglucosamine synthase-like glycosyltransferase